MWWFRRHTQSVWVCELVLLPAIHAFQLSRRFWQYYEKHSCGNGCLTRATGSITKSLATTATTSSCLFAAYHALSFLSVVKQFSERNPKSIRICNTYPCRRASSKCYLASSTMCHNFTPWELLFFVHSFPSYMSDLPILCPHIQLTLAAPYTVKERITPSLLLSFIQSLPPLRKISQSPQLRNVTALPQD